MDDAFEMFLSNLQGLDDRRRRELRALYAQGPVFAATEFWETAAGADVRYAPFEQCPHKEGAYWDEVFDSLVLQAPADDTRYDSFKTEVRRAYEHYWKVRDKLWQVLGRLDRESARTLSKFLDHVKWLPDDFVDGDPIATYADQTQLVRALTYLNTYHEPRWNAAAVHAALGRTDVQELKAICRATGLKVGGRRAEIEERIRQSLDPETLAPLVQEHADWVFVSVQRRSFSVLCVDWIVKSKLSRHLEQDIVGRYYWRPEEAYTHYRIARGEGTPCPRCEALIGTVDAYGRTAPRPPIHPGCDCKEEPFRDRPLI